MANRLGPDLRTAIGELVAVDAGDHAMFEAHRSNRFANAPRFVEVECRRTTGGDVAESAASRADIAEDHQRGGPSAPALAHVGALGALADGVKFLVVDKLLQIRITLSAGH